MFNKKKTTIELSQNTISLINQINSSSNKSISEIVKEAIALYHIAHQSHDGLHILRDNEYTKIILN